MSIEDKLEEVERRLSNIEFACKSVRNYAMSRNSVAIALARQIKIEANGLWLILPTLRGNK